MPACTNRACGADDLGKMCEKSDDVMLDFALDRIDALKIEFGVATAFQISFAADLRNHAKFGHRIGGVGLDLEPDAKPRLRSQIACNLRSRVAWYHVDLANNRAAVRRNRHQLEAGTQRLPRQIGGLAPRRPDKSIGSVRRWHWNHLRGAGRVLRRGRSGLGNRARVESFDRGVNGWSDYPCARWSGQIRQDVPPSSDFRTASRAISNCRRTR